MASSTGLLRRRLCRRAEIGVRDDQDGREWPAGPLLLASVARPQATDYLLAIPKAVLEGEALTRFLARVTPFGCPAPPSLIRAYSLPDSPYPSILLKEHEEAPEGVGEAYRRFLARARQPWLAALQETGPGLCPVLAWRAGTARRFLAPDE